MGLNEREAYLTIPLADGRLIDVLPLTFGRAQVGITEALTDQCYADVWCYETPIAAVIATTAWIADKPEGTGEPEGWTRHPASGRRRPNGDASAEYIRP